MTYVDPKSISLPLKLAIVTKKGLMASTVEIMGNVHATHMLMESNVRNAILVT